MTSIIEVDYQKQEIQLYESLISNQLITFDCRYSEEGSSGILIQIVDKNENLALDVLKGIKIPRYDEEQERFIDALIYVDFASIKVFSSIYVDLPSQVLMIFEY